MSYIINKKKQKIAFKSLKGKAPGIVYIHGLNSDMEGLKALCVESYAKKNKLAFIRFDCRGHGSSFGDFHDFTISDWKKDLFYVLDNLTVGPQILVGSSMGGWLMLLAARARSKKILGMVGLAAASDFGNDLYKNLSKKNKRELKILGSTEYNTFGFKYKLTKKFFKEAKKNNILKKFIRFNKPVLLIHGLNDDVVNIDMPKKICNIIDGNKVQILYLKSSDHRLSKPSDLISINNGLDSIRSMIT
ncbi:alpha/beta hydrolase [Alphaproteobacteria bacterium]|nr:alpha/beta hydrolase [Alphaproteobacteria bacterium]